MAVPVAFEGMTACLAPPTGLEDMVVPLPVQRLPDGQLVSCWELTNRELEEIRKTGRIWLSVWGGRTQPPVLVTGQREDVLPPPA